MQLLKGASGSRGVNTEWLARHLRFNFYLNRLATGDRLPSVRELARTLHISPNTALELYKELENAGLVETRPRSGTFLRRIGTEEDRTERDLTVFATIVRLARRLDLLGIAPTRFAELFLRYTGAAPNPDLTFGFICSGERFELLERQLAARLRWRLPVIALPPDAKGPATAREQIARDRTIRCVISSYLYCDLAFRLADEFDLAVIVERLDPSTAEVFEPPPSGCRYIVTRDAEFAAGIRQLTASAYGEDAATRLVVASLDDAERLAAVEDAVELFVSPPALDTVKAQYGQIKKVTPLQVDVSSETIEDLLFHYAFMSKRDAPNGTPPLTGGGAGPVRRERRRA
jgi:DNA-binding transcriptional regulator YhcF (GntR family)